MKGISQRWSLLGHVFCSESVRVTRSARRSIRRRRLHPPKNQCYIGHVRSASARLANVSLQICSKRRCLWRHEWFVKAGEWAAREPGWLPKPASAPAASKKKPLKREEHAEIGNGLPLQIFSSHTFSHPAQVCGSHRWCSPYLGRLATWQNAPLDMFNLRLFATSLNHITSLSIELPRNVVLQLCMGRSGRWLVGKTHTTRR